jgi:hypothetical protein
MWAIAILSDIAYTCRPIVSIRKCRVNHVISGGWTFYISYTSLHCQNEPMANDCYRDDFNYATQWTGDLISDISSFIRQLASSRHGPTWQNIRHPVLVLTDCQRYASLHVKVSVHLGRYGDQLVNRKVCPRRFAGCRQISACNRSHETEAMHWPIKHAKKELCIELTSKHS